ncbi:caspase family protein [Actinospica durhamensis]|uniref:Caspase family protein n=1 Tax=Actinospica durhamensis TaxID=1508375 RepID=A0A941EMI8_9ACTN|nr:caspase family protein [Actinospica durhamensis]MBR7833257.1 caspase family protein [Actinospica durhamensis]
MTSLELSDPQRSHAILIGTYSYQSLDELPAVKNNLDRLSQLMRHPEVWGLPEGNCVVLAQPTRDEFLEAVDDATRDAEDSLLFYYAGHGLTDPTTGELYLGLENSSTDRLYRSIRYEEIRSLLLGSNSGVPIKARRKVVILDCCWSGLALNGQMADGRDVATKVNVSGSYVLTATAETRQALAPLGATYTAFTGELLELIELGMAEGPEFLSMNALYQRLVYQLGAKRLPIPQQRNRNDAGEICLFRNRSSGGTADVSASSQASALPQSGTPSNVPVGVSGQLPGLMCELKRIFHDPHQRIGVYELFTGETNRVVAEVRDRSAFPVSGRDIDYVDLLEKYERSTGTLLPLLAVGAFPSLTASAETPGLSG